jgi:hypothetical protein
MRRRRETLLTTARGRELLADPEALVKVLHDDLGAKASMAMRGCSSRRCCMSTVRSRAINWRRSWGGC